MRHWGPLGPPRSSARPRPAPPGAGSSTQPGVIFAGAPRPGPAGVIAPRAAHVRSGAGRGAWALRPGTPGLAALGGRPLPACLPPAIARSGPPGHFSCLRCALRLRESERLCRSLGAASLRATVTLLRLGELLHPLPQPALPLEIKLQLGFRAVSLETRIRLPSA